MASSLLKICAKDMNSHGEQLWTQAPSQRREWWRQTPFQGKIVSARGNARHLAIKCWGSKIGHHKFYYSLWIPLRECWTKWKNHSHKWLDFIAENNFLLHGYFYISEFGSAHVHECFEMNYYCNISINPFIFSFQLLIKFCILKELMLFLEINSFWK